MSAAIWRRAAGVERGLGVDDRGERLAVDVLHDDEVGVVGLAPVEDRDDVRMREVCRRLCLPSEALDERVVGGELGEEHLQRDGSAEEDVACEVDLCGAAPCDLALQLVATVVDGRPGIGHVGRSLFAQASLLVRSRWAFVTNEHHRSSPPSSGRAPAMRRFTSTAFGCRGRRERDRCPSRSGEHGRGRGARLRKPEGAVFVGEIVDYVLGVTVGRLQHPGLQQRDVGLRGDLRPGATSHGPLSA